MVGSIDRADPQIRARQEGIELEDLMKAIKSKVDRAFMNQKLEEECFYMMHSPVMYSALKQRVEWCLQV